jgi:hypothetical protein
MIKGLPYRGLGAGRSVGAARKTVLSSLMFADHHLLIRPTKSLEKREMARVA